MRETRALTTTQVRIFPADILPTLNRILTSPHTQEFTTRLEFQATESVEVSSGVGLKFRTGVLDGIPINDLVVEERRIAVSVEGTSDVADGVYEITRGILAAIAKREIGPEIVCTHETVSTVVLNFPYERLLSDSVRGFSEKTATDLVRNQWSKALVVPRIVQFDVVYTDNAPALQSNSIALVNKRLRIEARSQTALEDRVYFIQSPTNTDTHFKLIDELERAMKPTGRRK